jgi:hypothetical protein
MFANYINTPNPSSPSSSSAGPSRSRPTPTRTLRQPHSLSVAQRDHSGALDPSSVSDVAAYEQAMRRKVELRRKGDKWAERLSEGVVDEDEFRRGVSSALPLDFGAASIRRGDFVLDCVKGTTTGPWEQGQPRARRRRPACRYTWPQCR